jgi:hypothetical protein
MNIRRIISAAVAALAPARLRRAIAVLMVGILICAPLVAFAAGVEGQAKSSHMVMGSDTGAMDSGAMDSGAMDSEAMDDMPCHQGKPDADKNCPGMANCVALCCQVLTVAYVAPATPITVGHRMLPLEPIQLNGIVSPPPSRPPKA